MASVAKAKTEKNSTEPRAIERSVIVVSDRAYEDIADACERDEQPAEALVSAYALYRQHVTSDR